MEKTRKDVCVPRHVAIIMDGNNRWAKKRLLPGVAGHKAGVDAVRAVIEVCAEAGVEVLTLFAFSSENWQRPADEVSALMELFLVALRREVRKLDENGIRLRIIGDRTRFHPELQAAMREAEAATAGNTRFLLQVAANYGGQWDIVQAAQRLAREVQGGHLAADDISAELLQGCLVTGDQPLPDLCIRTGGEHRISNFLLWQLAYAELYFSDLFWPDFKHAAMRAALADFSSASAASARPASKSRPRPVRHAETTDHHGAGALPIALGGFPSRRAFFALFIGAVVSLGAWEWARLAGYEQQFGRVAYAATVAVLMVALYHLPQLAGAVLLLALVWWTLATVLVLTYPESVGYWGSRWRRLGMGLLILLPAWQGLVLLKQWPLANGLIIAVMVLVWGADIGAYFSGKAFGKRKLAPRVSPGKSWEGVYGGLAASLAITLAVGLYRGWSLGALLLALLGAALVVFVSIVGDLTESMFKRQSGIKDSSNLLPGHGGVLDRIDSLTAAIPVFAALLWAAG